ncbi:hypothetical protein FMN50_12580 [Rhodobacterales bacterium]|nr:hypothetical protein FMN50_12580 [Rhodobacterales bacterium]
MTDVSAGALAAGTGAAAGAVSPAVAGAGASGGFAKELGDLMQGGKETAVPADELRKAGEELPDGMMPAAEGQVVVPQPVATAFAGADAAGDILAGETPVLTGTTASASAAAAAGLPAGQPVSGAGAPDSPGAAVPPSGLPQSEPGKTADVAAPKIMPGDAVGQKGMSEAAPGQTVAAQTPGADRAAEVLAKLGEGRGPAQAEATPRAGLAAQAKVVDTVAAQSGSAPADAGQRRWRSELPQELRAQLGAAGNAGKAGNASVVTGAGEGANGAASTTTTAGLSQPASGSGADTVTQGAALTGEPTVTRPTADKTSSAPAVPQTNASAVPEGDVRETSLADAPSADAEDGSDEAVIDRNRTAPRGSAEGAAANQASVQQGAAQQAMRQQAAAADAMRGERTADGAGGTSDAALAEDGLSEDSLAEDGGQDRKPGILSAEKAQRQAEKTAGASASDSGAPAPRGAGAAPVASAVLASQLLAESRDPATTTADWTVSGEAMGSVRGGDLHGAMRTDALQTPNQSQSGHVATQVAAEMARNLKDGHTRFQMRFDPPELGRVEVKMKVASDGSVHAHLVVDRPETLDLFLRDQRGLERALEQAGLNTDSSNLQFSLRQDGGQQFGSGQEQSDPFFDSPANSVAGEPDLDPVDEQVIRLTLAQQRGGLDLKV